MRNMYEGMSIRQMNAEWRVRLRKQSICILSLQVSSAKIGEALPFQPDRKLYPI